MPRAGITKPPAERVGLPEDIGFRTTRRCATECWKAGWGAATDRAWFICRVGESAPIWRTGRHRLRAADLEMQTCPGPATDVS